MGVELEFLWHADDPEQQECADEFLFTAMKGFFRGMGGVLDALGIDDLRLGFGPELAIQLGRIGLARLCLLVADAHKDFEARLRAWRVYTAEVELLRVWEARGGPSLDQNSAGNGSALPSASSICRGTGQCPEASCPLCDGDDMVTHEDTVCPLSDGVNMLLRADALTIGCTALEHSPGARSDLTGRHCSANVKLRNLHGEVELEYKVDDLPCTERGEGASGTAAITIEDLGLIPSRLQPLLPDMRLVSVETFDSTGGSQLNTDFCLSLGPQALSTVLVKMEVASFPVPVEVTSPHARPTFVDADAVRRAESERYWDTPETTESLEAWYQDLLPAAEGKADELRDIIDELAKSGAGTTEMRGTDQGSRYGSWRPEQVARASPHHALRNALADLNGESTCISYGAFGATHEEPLWQYLSLLVDVLETSIHAGQQGCTGAWSY